MISIGPTWLNLALLGLVVMSLASSCAAPGKTEAVAELVLRGGKVASVDASDTEFEALAIRGSRIVAIGSDVEIEAWIGPETRIIELGGRLAVPGFIEGHGHFLSLGRAKTILDLTRAESWDEIVGMVESTAREANPGEWIQGRGWHQEKWDSPPTPSVEGSPVHSALSAVSPANPVLLVHASGHAAFANAKALELAGLSRDSEDPAGGELVREPAGNLTGLLRETAQRLMAAALESSRAGKSAPELEAEQRRFVELAGEEALQHGVTSFHDAGVSFDTIDFFKTLEDEGSLPIRIYAMVRRQSNEEMDARLPDYRAVAEGNDFLTVRSIKRQIDGALGAHGAWLLEPYEDLPDSVGLVLEPEDEIRATAALALKHGFQVNTHAIGDRANRSVLDIYQETFATDPTATDLRWRIEHAQHLDPADIGRFAELGIVASMQGIHCTSDGPWVEKRLGKERTESGAYVWRRLIDSGALVTNGTDVPVESIDPIANFYASIGRITADGETFYPTQKMSRVEALRSYTINNAFAAFEEDLKGSLEVGKLADVVVLSTDILTVPIDEILTTRVDLTILGGEVRFER